LAIRDHYVGPAAVNHHVAKMEAKLDHLSWSNKVQSPFDTYISVCLNVFRTWKNKMSTFQDRQR
jgi:hypothetical protein